MPRPRQAPLSAVAPPRSGPPAPPALPGPGDSLAANPPRPDSGLPRARPAGSGSAPPRPPPPGYSVNNSNNNNRSPWVSERRLLKPGASSDRRPRLDSAHSRPNQLSGTAGATGFGFGAQQQQQQGAAGTIGLFGQQQQQAKPVGFGAPFGATATSSAPTAFGTTGGFTSGAPQQNNMFGGQNKPAFGGGFAATATSTPSFGFGGHCRSTSASRGPLCRSSEAWINFRGDDYSGRPRRLR